MTQIKDKEAPFEVSDIDDARIIIMVKGKHYSIISNGDKEEAKMTRVALVQCLLSMQDSVIVTPALEDIPKEKLIGLLNKPMTDDEAAQELNNIKYALPVEGKEAFSGDKGKELADAYELYQQLRINDTLPAMDADKKRLLCEAIELYGNKKRHKLTLLIRTMTPHMQEQYMRHDYRSMWEIWEMIIKALNHPIHYNSTEPF